MTSAEVFKPIKARRYGSPADIVTRSIAETKRAPKDLAHRLGVGRTTFHNFTDPDMPAHRLSWEHVERLVKEGAVAPVRHLCELAGGYFLRGGLPTEGASLTALAQESVTEQAQYVNEVLASAGKPLTEATRLKLMRELHDVIKVATTMQAFLLHQHCEDK